MLFSINTFSYRYMQFHPFAYIVKLNIESKKHLFPLPTLVPTPSDLIPPFKREKLTKVTNFATLLPTLSESGLPTSSPVSMADLIAKVSRSNTSCIDSSGVYSHAISQLASGHHDAKLTFPSPAKVATKHPYNTCNSDVELNDIMYGKEFAPGAGFEMDLKRDVQVQVESVDSSDTSVKEGDGDGEREISIAPTEEDMRPLKHGKQAWESKYGVGVAVHAKAWSCESEVSGC
jgi:hypothetical protein